MGIRTTTPHHWEARLVSEYLLKRFPLGTQMLRVPLGPIPDYIIKNHGLDLGSKMYRPSHGKRTRL